MDGDEEEGSCQRIRSNLMFVILLLLAFCFGNISLPFLVIFFFFSKNFSKFFFSKKEAVEKNITVNSKLKSTQRCLVGSILARL